MRAFRKKKGRGKLRIKGRKLESRLPFTLLLDLKYPTLTITRLSLAVIPDAV